MFSAEIRSLLFQVITSWQILAVTVVLVLYFVMVSYVANIYHRRPRKSAPLPKKKAAKSNEPEGPVVSATDELGLEEHTPEKDG